jgi:alkanesulfonate monooxygenase SsuD/methylene tetrahydromethanopterin reductase-like flavin-dependent oxidoreductase (luciferase family)
MFGAQLLNQRTSWLEIKSVLAVMEAGPWTSVYTYDHFIPPLSPTAEILEHDQWDTLEGWALLAAVAAVTTKLKLGVLVSGTTYRNPALLAKMAATIDEVSGGRAILGIGAGWNVREHEAYGWAFPSMKERSDRLEEACAVIQKLFNSDALVDYDGKYYQLKQAPFAPRGVNGKIPLMVGGTGPKRTLKTLAMYGDQMNVIAGPEDLKRARATLAEHCAAIGRDPNEISSTVHVPIRIVNDEKAAKEQRGEKTWSLIGPKQWVIDRCGDFIDAGVDEFCFMSIRQRPEVYQELTEEVLSAFN